MSLLDVDGVTKDFGHVRATEEVSFSIDGREVVGLLGANGAGKTTAMRQALGILAPSEGTVTHFGVAPSRRTRARIGYVPQGLGLWADLSVRENLRFVERAYGSEGDREAAPSDIDAGVPVGELSLGRQRRVAFAAAFGHRPELLILDEPTSGVDALSRSRLWDAIRTHAENGAGVLVSTHFMDEARQCDRLLVMSAGRIILRGTPEEIIGGRRVVQVDGRDWSDVFTALDSRGFACALAGTSVRVLTDDTTPVRRALDEAGVVAELSERAATLEEAMVSVARSGR